MEVIEMRASEWETERVNRKLSILVVMAVLLVRYYNVMIKYRNESQSKGILSQREKAVKGEMMRERY